MKTITLLLLTLGLTSVAQAKIIAEQIDYESGNQTMKGYLAYDDAISGKRPGVIVIHEWWGHNDYARSRARQLAALGYTAFALDMYGEGKTANHPKRAASFSNAVWKNLPQAHQRFQAAYDILARHETVNTELAAIGYCFGGAMVLEMARSGFDLKGVASFHGSLNNAAPLPDKAYRAKVLVANGGDDPFVKPEHIKAFRKSMKNANIDLEYISYPGAKHAFTNPDATALGEKFGLPLAYNAEADKRSWEALQAFLKRVFDSGPATAQ